MSPDPGSGSDTAPTRTGRAPAAAAPLSTFVRRSNIVAVAGQVGVEPRSGTRPGSFGEQVKLALTNLEQALREAGCAWTDVVMVRAYLTREQDLQQFNEIYLGVCGGRPLPARTTVIVGLVQGLLVEVDALAVLP